MKKLRLHIQFSQLTPLFSPYFRRIQKNFAYTYNFPSWRHIKDTMKHKGRHRKNNGATGAKVMPHATTQCRRQTQLKSWCISYKSPSTNLKQTIHPINQPQHPAAKDTIQNHRSRNGEYLTSYTENLSFCLVFNSWCCH